MGVRDIWRALFPGSPQPSMSVDQANPLLALAEKYYSFPYSKLDRKPDNYLDLYHSLLAGFRDRPINLLELGVSSGASTLMWLDYFPFANFAGIDLRAK